MTLDDLGREKGKKGKGEKEEGDKRKRGQREKRERFDLAERAGGGLAQIGYGSFFQAAIRDVGKRRITWRAGGSS